MFSVRLLTPDFSLTLVCFMHHWVSHVYMGQFMVILQESRNFFDQALDVQLLKELDAIFKDLLKLKQMFMLNYVKLFCLNFLRKLMYRQNYCFASVEPICVSAETYVLCFANVLLRNGILSFKNSQFIMVENLRLKGFMD